jgi:hypothetical protein
MDDVARVFMLLAAGATVGWLVVMALRRITRDLTP